MAEQKIIRKLTPKQREALEKIAATAAELGISEAKLCERIGITGSALSQIRKGYYAGNWDNQFEKIYAYFENKAAASETYSEVEYAPRKYGRFATPMPCSPEVSPPREYA